MLDIAVFASGNGTNAANLIEYFKQNESKGITVSLLICNKSDAYVLKRAEVLGVKSIVLSKEVLLEESADPANSTLGVILKEHNIGAIILAGYLLKIPASIVSLYKDRIINIHPSLLPKYSGKGMYGERVHKAVLERGEEYSGITIHLVDEEFDHGKILFQSKFALSKEETLESLESKIHIHEHNSFPMIVDAYLRSFPSLRSG